ncbi:MAG: PID-CTERM protein-sorting domain-containing protein [Bacteroidia bacterium]|jgi:hypothetical protein
MKNSFLLFIVVFASIAALKVSAQSLPPPPPPPPSPVPIDGGLSLVIAGCVGYGMKKINDNRKAKQ